MNRDQQKEEHTEIPVVEAELTFLPKEEGGRANPFGVGALRSRIYRPHIVFGDIDQREPIVEVVDGIRYGNEEYLGVIFLDGPETVGFGEGIRAKMGLLYYPKLSYAEAVPDRTFTLREAGRRKSERSGDPALAGLMADS